MDTTDTLTPVDGASNVPMPSYLQAQDRVRDADPSLAAFSGLLPNRHFLRASDI